MPPPIVIVDDSSARMQYNIDFLSTIHDSHLCGQENINLPELRRLELRIQDVTRVHSRLRNTEDEAIDKQGWNFNLSMVPS